jgi:MFS family permease
MGRVFAWARRTPYLAGLPRDVAVLSFVAFAVALGYGIAAPALPVYARTFGVSAFLASAVISGFALMRLLSATPAGLMVDRFGERRIMSIGIWVVAGSSLLTALAQSFGQLLVLRGVGGIGSSMFTVSAMALLLRTAGPEQRGRASGAFQAGFLFGGVAGPAIGGLVTGISIRAPFVVYGFTLIVAGLLAVRFLSREPGPGPEPGPEPAPAAAAPPAQGPPARLGPALRSAAYRAALMVNLSSGFIVFGLRISLVPLFVTEGLNRGVQLVGIGFLCAAAVQAATLIPAGRRTDRAGRRGSLLIGTTTMAVAMLLLVVDTGPVGFLVSMAASGLAAAFLAPASAAVVGDMTRGRSGGRVVSAYQMVGDLGGILGPLLAGALADALGFHWAFGAGLAVAAVALTMVLAMPETLRPTPPPSREVSRPGAGPGG